MTDGRSSLLLGRLVAIVERTGGELVLTKDQDAWTAVVLVGDSRVAPERRGRGVGRGTLFAALANLERGLSGATLPQLPTARSGVERPAFTELSVPAGRLSP